MRIVLVSPYFVPDTPPYATMLDAVARRLGRDGHDVVVLTCQPSYNRFAAGRAPKQEALDGNVVVRRRRTFAEGRRLGLGRLVNVVLLCASVITAGRWIKRADVVMAVSTPPIVLGLSGLVLARRCRADFVYHKQDIHPDSAAAIGLGPSRPLVKVLRRLDSWTDLRSHRIVVLSRDMAATQADRGTPPERLRVINNFDPWERKLRAEVSETDGRHEPRSFRVVFAGNLGRFQGLRSLLLAAAALSDADRIRFDLIGEGALRAELEQEAAAQSLPNITFHGYLPPDETAVFLREQASLGVVSLAPGIIRTAYPSKTMSYLRNGCPVIAMVESDSELATDLEEAGAGVVVAPGDWEGLASTVEALHAEPLAIESMRAAAGILYEKAFARESRLADWSILAREMASPRVG